MKVICELKSITFNELKFFKVTFGASHPIQQHSHIGIGPQHCHLWEFNPHGGLSLTFYLFIKCFMSYLVPY